MIAAFGETTEEEICKQAVGKCAAGNEAVGIVISLCQHDLSMEGIDALEAEIIVCQIEPIAEWNIEIVSTPFKIFVGERMLDPRTQT